MSVARVRVRPKPLNHDPQAPWGAPPLKVPRPEFLRVHLPPERPRDFHCGTEWVWRVVEDEVVALCGPFARSDQVYVCEHEVDCD